MLLIANQIPPWFIPPLSQGSAAVEIDAEITITAMEGHCTRSMYSKSTPGAFLNSRSEYSLMTPGWLTPTPHQWT